LAIKKNEKKEENRRISSQHLTTQLLQLKQKHSEIMERIKRSSPEYTSLISVNPLPAREIQALIRAEGNTALLEYYTTPEATYLWLLDGKQIHPRKIDIGQYALDNKIREYHTMLSNTTFGIETLRDRARELYDLLLKPVEQQITGKIHIGVIPHAGLHYLPFETLMKNGSFLVEKDLKIFYLPNAGTYKYCKDKNKKTREQIIAVGNPDGTLFFSGKEVKELKRIYPKDTEIFTGAQASESRVKYYAPYPDIFHFACHGSFNARRPMYSALHLLPDPNNDGSLEVHEIYQLELKPAYLVTLSACQTHLGGIKRGDEIIGLTRAFIYAGTSGILASLWEVDDYYTEKFMIAFYRALKTADKIKALHTARQTMIRQYGKKHPFYWAAFVLIGDPR
jgi:CHAT domain-containing protein